MTDNKTYSGLFGLQVGGNTFYVGLQKVSGDNGWMRVNGTSGGTLANDSFNSSYDNANERSRSCAMTTTSPAWAFPPDHHEPLHQRRPHRGWWRG